MGLSRDTIEDPSFFGVGPSRVKIHDPSLSDNNPTICGVGLSRAKTYHPHLSSVELSRSRIHDPSLSDKVLSSSFPVWGCPELGSMTQTLQRRTVQGSDPRPKPFRCWSVQGWDP